MILINFKYMSKLLIWLSAAFFLFYWILTIFFNLPPNPIKIRYAKEEKIFQSIFFQKWAFFAPPPQANDKLYYYFRSKIDTTDVKVFEALDVIAKNKQIAAPFNSDEEIQDYIISGSIAEITDFLFSRNKQLKLKLKNGEDKGLPKKAINDAWLLRNKIYGIKTLLNYGKEIGGNLGIDLNIYDVRFMITSVELLKFKDAGSKIKLQENKIFETPYTSIK